MFHSSARTLTISLALLLSGTSLAQAGFIWIAPEEQAAPAGDTVFGSQEPAAPEQNNESWTLAPGVPSATMPTPLGQAAPVVMAPEQPVTDAVPMEISAPPAPTPLSPPASSSGPISLVTGQTVAGTPVVSAGDQPIVSALPVETTTMPQQVSQPAVTMSAPSSSSTMPTAEALINGMPSMTAPKAPAPAVAIKAPAPSQPAVSSLTGANLSNPAPAPAPAPVVASAPAQPVSQPVVDGFGKQVPLVIAARQIVPSSYTFSHADGVDLGQPVDWQGGKPWPEVLQDAVEPLGLKATVAGDTVLLEKADAIAPLASAAPLTPPATVQNPLLAPNPGAQAVLTNATIMQTPPAN